MIDIDLLREIDFAPDTKILVVYEGHGSVAFYLEDQRVDPMLIVPALAKGLLRLAYITDIAPYRTTLGTELRIKAESYYLAPVEGD